MIQYFPPFPFLFPFHPGLVLVPIVPVITLLLLFCMRCLYRYQPDPFLLPLLPSSSVPLPHIYFSSLPRSPLSPNPRPCPTSSSSFPLSLALPLPLLLHRLIMVMKRDSRAAVPLITIIPAVTIDSSRTYPRSRPSVW